MKKTITLLLSSICLICVGCHNGVNEKQQECAREKARIAELYEQLATERAQHHRELDEVKDQIRMEREQVQKVEQRVEDLMAAIRSIRKHIDSRTPAYESIMDLYMKLASEEYIEDTPEARKASEDLETMRKQIQSQFGDYLKIKAILDQIPAENPKNRRESDD